MIEIKHWDQVEPFAYKAPNARGMTFSRNERMQVIAVEDEERIVGRWRFSLAQPGLIDSWHTWVSGRLRGQGLARRLWLAGVERWKPVVIEVGAISYEGTALIAAMTIALAGRVEVKFTNVRTDGWYEVYQRELARIGLREVIRLRRTLELAEPAAPPRPRLEAVS